MLVHHLREAAWGLCWAVFQYLDCPLETQHLQAPQKMFLPKGEKIFFFPSVKAGI